MASILKYDGIKFEKGSVKKITDPITVEKALQISINQQPFTVVMQTPGDEVELAIGLLYSEDIIKSTTSYEIELKYDDDNIIEDVNFTIAESDLGKGYLSSRSLLSVSSCGICGKQSINDIQTSGKALENTKNKIDTNFIFKLQKIMTDSQTIFPHTGSTHGIALFDKQGNLLTCKEDIGRHNALDKSIGELIQKKKLQEAEFLFFSGRISYEIVIKSFRAKIKLIIAISAPSSLAIDYAKEFGINLIGYCRNAKFTCYTDPDFLDLSN